MEIPIIFSDLTYMDNGKPVNYSVPFGISLVASYAKKKLGDKIDIEIFKYPSDLKMSLESKSLPRIACFSNFCWNLDLSYSYAKKIKDKSPETIIIFGGANYPIETDERIKFLAEHRAIDFYVRGEGEIAFVKLFEDLEKFDFNAKNLKREAKKIENCDYLIDGKFISGELMPRIVNLDEIPSPYISGILDKFLSQNLLPLVENIRGCPFHCLYCLEGNDYFSKISKFSVEHLKEEIEYIAKKTKAFNLMFVDSNFGVYEQDIEVAKVVADIQKKYGWPKFIDTGLGKNKKRVSEVTSILKGNISIGAPVQSTDPVVLENIKRKNISIGDIIELAKTSEDFDANSYSEVILCLPGDTKSAHFKSMSDMIDAGINIVRSHQLLMLPCSEISNKEIRKKYDMVTKFRLQPRCFGINELFGERFPSCEIDEICVANNTMSYRDYLECRMFNLTIELFYNNGIFKEFINFLKTRGVLPSQFVRHVHSKIPGNLKELYDKFLEETESLWEKKEELERFIKQPGMIEKYKKEEIRSTEQIKYRAIGFFRRMRDLHEIALQSARELLKTKGQLDEETDDYLRQLFEFSISRKEDLLSLDRSETKKFSYDFLSLSKDNFKGNPFEFSSPEIEIKFYHSKGQKELISDFLGQFGSSAESLGRILSRSHANKFYREVERIN